MSYGADTGDDAEGRRGPHSASHRTHHTPVQGSGGRLRSSLHPGAQPPQLWAQRGAQTDAPPKSWKHTSEHIYGHANQHTTKPPSTVLRGKEKKKKETWRIPLMASVIRRQQTALSRDISTWHKHAFLKCFSLCSGSISYLLVYMQSWDRDKDQKSHKESWVCWSSSRTLFQDGTAQRRVVCFEQNEESMLVTHNSFF